MSWKGFGRGKGLEEIQRGIGVIWVNSVESLEAQQRYFSYRGILVAIASQKEFVLVLMGCCTTIARYVAKWGIIQMCLSETK